MDIPEPPDKPICSGCNHPLRWVYDYASARLVALVFEEGGLIEVHRCDRPADVWKPDPVVARRAHEHAALIRERFGWTKKHITEGRTTT